MAMPLPIPDVTFPIFGSGETAVVRDRLPLRLLSLSGTTIDARWCGADMSAPHWRFYLDLDDGAEVRVGLRATHLRAGALYAIPAWLRWSARCQGRVRHFNAMVDVPGLPRERVVAACTGVLQLAGPEDALAQDWLRFAIGLAAVDWPDAAGIARGHALVYAALAEVLARPGMSDLITAGDDAGLAQLQDWAGRRLHEPIGRASLARAAGCSEAELARRFHAALVTTPGRWLRERRVALAAELLRATGLPIDAVAERCGLGERSHFSRVFARLCGCGPAAYRRRAQG
jgi:AraC-like DNA-binding protein